MNWREYYLSLLRMNSSLCLLLSHCNLMPSFFDEQFVHSASSSYSVGSPWFFGLNLFFLHLIFLLLLTYQILFSKLAICFFSILFPFNLIFMLPALQDRKYLCQFMYFKVALEDRLRCHKDIGSIYDMKENCIMTVHHIASSPFSIIFSFYLFSFHVQNLLHKQNQGQVLCFKLGLQEGHIPRNTNP